MLNNIATNPTLDGGAETPLSFLKRAVLVTFLPIIFLGLFFPVLTNAAAYYCAPNSQDEFVDHCVEFTPGDTTSEYNAAQECSNKNIAAGGSGGCQATYDTPEEETTHQTARAAEGNMIDQLINFIKGTLYWIISLPVMLSGLFLLIAGKLFDTSVLFTISNFTANYNEFFAAGVKVGWETMRDVANIIMIGMFVYIAFRVMLGIESLNMKSFAARILIIALLINFSLFFTKVFIDVSNMTAYQFLKSLTVEDGAISERMSGFTGIGKNVFDGAQNTVQKLTEGSNDIIPISVLVYVIVASIVNIGLGAVLLMGAILLITRMIVFILLMLLSALAFASWIMPGVDKNFGVFWKKLTQYALFAPLYMLLLSAVISMMDRFTSLETLLLPSTSNTSSVGVDYVKALLVAAFVIGLFYAATKIASELSIMGAGYAEKVAKKGAGFAATWSGLTLPASGLAALTRGGASLAQKANAFTYSRTGGMVGSARLDKQLDKMKKDFRLSSTKFGQSLGMQKPVSTEDKAKLYAGASLKRAENDVKDAEKKLTPEEQKNVRDAGGKAPELGSGGGADTKVETKIVEKESGSAQQTKALLEETRKANAGKREELHTLRAQLSGAKGPAANILKKQISEAEKQVASGDDKIAGLTDAIQRAGQERVAGQMAPEATQGAPARATDTQAINRVDRLVNRVLNGAATSGEAERQQIAALNNRITTRDTGKTEISSAARRVAQERAVGLKGAFGDAVRKELAGGTGFKGAVNGLEAAFKELEKKAGASDKSSAQVVKAVEGISDTVKKASAEQIEATHEATETTRRNLMDNH